jgi:Fe2+ transport system protein FeoA
VGRGPGLDEVSGLGIHLGDEVVVVREAPFRGPLLVEVPSSGVRVALARRMAGDIRVEPAHG